MKVARTLAVIAVGFCFAAGALAQGYPSKPVRIVVPFGERGAADIIARAVGQKLSEIWGQPVVVENHVGGGGTLGIGVVAKSPPDGYTLLVHSSAFATSPALYTNLPYDPVKDFIGIAPLSSSPFVLVVGKPAGINTVAELIAAIKAKPGEFKFSGGYAGTRAHLGAEKFNLETNIQAVHVPAPLTPSGSREMIAETIAGRITYMPLFGGPGILPPLREGKLIALAVTSARRSSLLPEIPTVAEASLTGFDYTEWQGMWAPAGTPADIVDKIGKDVARALAAPDLRASLMKMTGVEPMSMSPTEFARFVASESESAAHLVKAAGITPQAAQTGAPASGSATGGPRPTWQQRMDEARREAAAGNTKVLRGPSGVLAMYNNPQPFCYRYMIPGDWVEAEEPGLYRSRHGKASAGVAFRLTREFESARGATLVERAATVITREHEKAMGRALAGVALTPFESARPSTWKWTAASSVQGNTLSGVAPKVLVDLSPEAVAQITVFGTPDDDGLTRTIIESLKTTSDPQCYWAELERELKSMYAER